MKLIIILILYYVTALVEFKKQSPDLTCEHDHGNSPIESEGEPVLHRLQVQRLILPVWGVRQVRHQTVLKSKRTQNFQGKSYSINGDTRST